MKSVQTVIVGQGLAGTAVAWQLHERGSSFLVVDNGDLRSSSQIAPGLVTPITGMRHVESWARSTAYPIATDFYRRIEDLTKAKFWKVEPALRIFSSQEERDLFDSRYRTESRISSHSESLFGTDDEFKSELEKSGLAAASEFNWGGFVMHQSARLFTKEYLNASREYFKTIDSFCESRLDVKQDIDTRESKVFIKSLGICCEKLVFCEGHAAIQNPWFNNMELVPAQGDILTVRIPGWRLGRVIHKGFWIAPVGLQQEGLEQEMEYPNHEDIYLVGSTYRWAPLDGFPNQESREILSKKLESFIHRPFEILDQRAAIRPAGFDHKPLIGMHPLETSLWVLNGLGAKGSMLSPWCARMLVDAMWESTPIPTELAWDRKRKKSK